MIIALLGGMSLFFVYCLVVDLVDKHLAYGAAKNFLLYGVGFIAVHKKLSKNSNWRPLYMFGAPIVLATLVAYFFGFAAFIGFVLPLAWSVTWFVVEFLKLIGGNWKTRKPSRPRKR